MTRFTVASANAALASVIPHLEALRDAQAQMTDRHAEVVEASVGNGGGEAGIEVMQASRAAGRALAALEEIGVVVRDAASGLIDFPSERDGEEIFLCWRLGEDAVAWWHPTTSGFSDRRPL